MSKSAKKRKQPDAPKTACAASDAECPVVGIGASAGGFEAFQQFFSQMPGDSGMAFVLVQHLNPKHDTLMPELLAKHTPMRVLRAEEGMLLEANQIYIIPPGAALALEGCRLRAALAKRKERNLVDSFFRSLADDQREKVVGIILSGTGTDGALGLKAIKEQGGLSMAQSLDTASFDGMPRHAIASGLVDFVLPPAEMPGRILEYVRHLRAVRARKGAESVQEGIVASLRLIFPILRRKTGHDFSRYKQSTLVRRVQRRMQLMYLDSAAEYVRLLREDANEAGQLFKDLLIGVTQFFRDADSFENLAQQALRPILKEKRPEGVIRIWTPGCATGEEAYTLAFLVSEEMTRLKKPLQVQIFATDLDDEALEFARRGRYSESIADQVSPERLERFFVRQGDAYEVAEDIREMCIFSPHNLIKDPPFSRLDVISCRNLLIYLEADVQKRLLPLFHYALNPAGFLFLGPSENLASRSELFRVADKKHRIFQRKPTTLRPHPHVSLMDTGRITRLQPAAPPPAAAKDQNIPRTIERVILEEFAPASVVINDQGDILYFSGKTGKYLEHQAGAPSNKLLNMAKKALRLELRSAVHRAVTEREEVARENIALRSGKGAEHVDLVVRPLSELGKDSDLFIVIFQETRRPAPPSARQTVLAQAALDHAAVQLMENELRTTREDLQTTIEELESSNEELKSANEELLSMNEELQSTNEELQTSKEELQSLNDELQRKVEELDVANSDMHNLLQSTQIATVFVDARLRIKKLTPAASQFLPISDQDIGRNLMEAAPDLAKEGIAEDVERVLRTFATRERSLKFGQGRLWHLLRITPYRNLEKVAQGAVLTFADVTQLKRAEESSAQLAAIVTGSQDAVIGLALDGTIQHWNPAAERLYGYSAGEAIGKSISFLTPPGRGEDFPRLLRQVRQSREIGSFESQRVAKDGRLIDVSLSVSPIRNAGGELIGISKIARDITEKKRTEQALRQSEAEFRLLAESMPQMVWTGRENGDFDYVNQRWCEFTGLSPEEAMGLGWTKALHPEDAEKTLATWRKVLVSGEKPYDVECRIRRASDGVYRWHLGRAIPIRYQDGHVKKWFGTCTDIDDQKRIELALKETQVKLNAHMEHLESEVAHRTASLKETVEALEGVTYTIAHDLRAPLRAVQGFSRILLDEYSHGFDAEGKDFAERIAAAATRMDTLINDLLAYAKLNHIRLEASPLLVHRELEHALDALGPVVQTAGAIIEVEPSPARVMSNSTLLQHVFYNLITNAIKFVSPGVTPRVRIWTEERGGMTRIFFKDNGIGIARDHQGKIFGLFQRLHTQEAYPGTGVGLAIVSKSMERLGGAVGLESAPGQGSVFYLDLRAAEQSGPCERES